MRLTLPLRPKPQATSGATAPDIRTHVERANTRRNDAAIRRFSAASTE